MAMTTAEAIAALSRALSAAEAAVRAADRVEIEGAVSEIERAATLLPAEATLSTEETAAAHLLARRARSLFLAIEQASTADAILLRALRDVAADRLGADLGPTTVDLRG
jgi:hypothetical protein